MMLMSARKMSAKTVPMRAKRGDYKCIRAGISTGIRAIAFDIGGVVWEEGIDHHYGSLARKYGIDKKKFQRARRKYLPDASRGFIKGYDFVDKVAKELGIPKENLKLFRKDWVRFRTEKMALDHDVYDILVRLKKNYRVGTLTNIVHLHQQIRLKLKTYKPFQFNVISCHTGFRKPEKGIYMILLRRLKLHPSQIVFIDDFEENLVPARKLGMHAILFKDARMLERDLKRLGLRF